MKTWSAAEQNTRNTETEWIGSELKKKSDQTEYKQFSNEYRVMS